MAVNSRCICGNPSSIVSCLNIRRQRLLDRVNCLCTRFVFCAILLCLVKPTLGGDSLDCNAVRLGFQSRGINTTDLLQLPSNGKLLIMFINKY